MLRFSKAMTSAANVIEYYDAHLSRQSEGYYLKEHDDVERNGIWFGRLAEEWGIAGTEVDRETFTKLANHINPVTGEKLTARRKENRRVAFDVSMSVPKSVSAAAIFDDRITDALLATGREVMSAIQDDIQVRVRKAGVYEDRVTKNLIASEHIHKATRPLKDSGISQPQWHLHYLLFNVSRDPEEDLYKSLQLGQVRRDAPYYQAMMHTIMASKLQDLGYRIRKTDSDYEIAGIPDSVRSKFSGRSKEIKELIDDLGLTSAKSKADAGAWSRSKKTKQYSLEELIQIWTSQLTENELRAIERARNDGGDDDGPWAPSGKVSAEQSVNWALKHGHESYSSMNHRRVIADALKFGVGHVSLEEIEKNIAKRDDIIKFTKAGEKRIGHRDILKQELDVIDRAKAGKGTRKPLISSKIEFEPIIEDGKRFELTSDQILAIRHILGSRDKTVLIEGRAGTGKTRMMKSALTKILNDAGKETITLAPTARASRGVLRDEGFADADTLQRFLDNPETMAAARGKVIYLDEAAAASADDIHRLFVAADQYDFGRVILQGDPNQHESPKRSGQLFNLLKKRAGLEPAVLDTIMRQKGMYAKAERLLGEGKTLQGFDLLDRLGMIAEVTSDDLYSTAAKEAMQSLERGVDTGVGSPIRADGRRVTKALRQSLRDRGLLGNSEMTFKRLDSRHLSVAQKEVASSYRPGTDIIQFMKKVNGFKVGERVTVNEIRGDRVMVQRSDGSTLPLALDDVSAARFDVFMAKNVTLAEADNKRGIHAGDRVAIRKDASTSLGRPIKKGQEYRVGAVGKETLTLTDGAIIDKTLARKIKPRGDKIKFTSNGFSLDGRAINNGDIAEIKRFKDGNIELTDGRIVASDFKSFDLGWSLTSIASQGSGFQKHVVVMGSDSIGPAVNLRQFYVDTSRGKGRKGLMVFTDDKAALREAIQREGGDESMTESLEQAQLEQRKLVHRKRYDAMHKRALHWLDTQKHRLKHAALQMAPDPPTSSNPEPAI